MVPTSWRLGQVVNAQPQPIALGPKRFVPMGHEGLGPLILLLGLIFVFSLLSNLLFIFLLSNLLIIISVFFFSFSFSNFLYFVMFWFNIFHILKNPLFSLYLFTHSGYALYYGCFLGYSLFNALLYRRFIALSNYCVRTFCSIKWFEDWLANEMYSSD